MIFHTTNSVVVCKWLCTLLHIQGGPKVFSGKKSLKFSIKFKFSYEVQSKEGVHELFAATLD